MTAKAPKSAWSGGDIKTPLVVAVVVLAITLIVVVTVFVGNGGVDTKNSKAGAADTQYRAQEREKGQDVYAMSMARTMETAMETYYADNNDYFATVADLTVIDNWITATAPCGGTTTVTLGTTARKGVCSGRLADGATPYAVCANSQASGCGSTHTFAIARSANGTIARTCRPATNGLCPTGSTW